MKAPFPWYGGKSRAAHLIWPRFGNVPNYVEPFAGGLAVLLMRPHSPRVETVNDIDAHLSNFWRALKNDPDHLAGYCDWPVNEADLHARHAFLIGRVPQLREALMADPDYYDCELAGWWVWGLCQWIGGGWCGQRCVVKATGDVATKRPELRRGGRGITRTDHTRPNLSNYGMGVHRERPRLQRGGTGVTRTWRRQPEMACRRGVQRSDEPLLDYLQALSDRLRRVRVCCGDFERILGPAATTSIGLTAVLLDPPYSEDAGRDGRIYAEEDLQVAHRAREWALANGDNPMLRIALCGYEGEHEMPDNWECVAWKGHGGTAKKTPRTTSASGSGLAHTA